MTEEKTKNPLNIPLFGNNPSPVLFVVLVIAAFLIGALWTKVQYLEKNGSSPATLTAAQAAPVGNQPQAPVPGQKYTVDVGHFPVKGKDNAKVTIVAFEDFRCPFCERTFTDIEPKIFKDYVDTGKVKFAYRHYQFLGAASVFAGNAAECANEQKKFWDFHDYLYKNQPNESDTSMYTVDRMTEIAGQLGLNVGQFKSCLSSNKYQKNVDRDFADGQKAGVTGTPTFYINGIQLVGAQPYSAFKTIIDQELSK